MADENSIGKRRVSAVTRSAEQKARIAALRRDPVWPEPGKPLNGVAPGAWKAERATEETGCLPEDCPVRPLGYDGEQYFFVDTKGQIFNSGVASLGVERIQKLFSRHEDFLAWGWPAYARDGKRVTGFKAEEVRRDLYAACDKRGPFSMRDMVRGRGAWRDSEGRLVLHCGDYLFYDGALQDTGEVGDHFYVRRPASITPWPEPVPFDDNPAMEVFRALRTWNLERGDTDVMIFMGWIVVSMLGAALDWRPSIFIVGDAGSGKSALIGRDGLLRAIIGRALIATTNATEAGLYQLVGHDSLPIAIDELEGDDNPDQARKIIKMARDAASGSVRIRGGADHQGVEFEAQSTFLFSAINPPGLPPASLTRLAIIQMNRLPNDGDVPKLKAAETIGPRLLRRIADNIGKFPAIYEQYRTVLRASGHDSRGQNTFGTFLAAAHMLLGDEGMDALGLPYESLEHWGAALAADAVPELGDVRPPWLEFLDHLFASPIDLVEHGQRYTVAQVLDGLSNDSDNWNLKKAQRYLAAADIALIDRSGERMGFWLGIPNSSKIIGRLMADTAYGDRGGNGSWSWALRRGPRDMVLKEVPAGVAGRKSEGNRIYVAGVQRRCLFVYLGAFQAWQAQR